MKHSKKPLVFLLIYTCLLPLTGFSQQGVATDSIQTRLKETARKIMAAAGTCTLITVDENCRPRAREMDPFSPEPDFSVWFGTNSKSRKVEQINKNSAVSIYYLDSDRSGYVLIYGKAELVNDASEKEKHWKTAWEAFYPNRDENYTLIKVIPEWMEVLSDKHGVANNPITWEPPKVYFNLE